MITKWIWECTTWGCCLGVWKLNVGNGMKNERTTRWKDQNIRHMHELDIKGQFTLFFWKICNMKHHLLFNGWKCVKDQLLLGIIVDENIVWLSRPPTWKTYTYEKMWTYGNHYHANIESRLWHLTSNYGVACIFKQVICSSTRYWNFVMGNLNYVGVLKQILVVDYASLPMVLFTCSWIPINTRGNAIVKMNMSNSPRIHE
jgi:hypothetical protein